MSSDIKSPAVKSLFDSRSNSFFESEITSLGVLSSINVIYSGWKKLCRIRSLILRGVHGTAFVNRILI